MGASDRVLDDPRSPSNLLSCQKLRVVVVFLLDCVLARWSFPHERKVCCSLFAMVIMNAASPLI